MTQNEYNSNSKVKILCNTVKNCTNSYNALVLAFSGGLDSTVLLDIITLLRLDGNKSKKNLNTLLRAIYINHGLNPASSNWIKHCEHECKLRNVEFNIVNVNVNNSLKNTEASARIARYFALSKSLLNKEVLVTAHHKDDQVETLLLALKRGSGPKGLSGMKLDTKFYNNRLIRPLLNFTKKELEEYAKIRKLNWIEDPSNKDTRFDRNFLRIDILPLLYKRWPNFATTVSRSAEICLEQEQLLDELLISTLNKIVQSDGSLCLLQLKNMSCIKRFALLRRWLSIFNIDMPSRQKLILIWKEVVLSKIDASKSQIQINNNQQVRRFRNRLYVVSLLPKIHLISNKILYWDKIKKYLILPLDLGFLFAFILNNDIVEREDYLFFEKLLSANKKASYIQNFNSEYYYTTKNNKYCDKKTNILALNYKEKLSKIIIRPPLDNERVSVRFDLKTSDLIHIVGRNKGRSLKKIMQELNVPPWKRKTTPMLFYNDKLIAALDVFITIDGRVNKSEKQLNIFWLKKDNLI